MFQKIDPEKVLSIVRRIGPCVPNEVRKELGLSDSLIVGATLSELLRAGKISTTNVRKGASALYYDHNNPSSLEKASPCLNEKDVRTYNLLKEKKVLGDHEVEPLTRVSLRNISDFSKKLSINYKNQELVFWRYFLISQEEAVSIIKERLGIHKKKVDKKEEIKEVSKPREEIKSEVVRSKVVREEVVEKPKETIKELTKEKIVKPLEEIQKRLSEKENKEEKEDKENKEEDRQENNLEEINDKFYYEIKNYFDKNNIKVVEQKLIRKNSEIDFIILLPSPLGDVKYFCKTKSKKKSNDGDLASAKMQGLSQNLPTAYLTTGEVTKKAKAKLDNELKGIVVKEL